MKIPTGLGYGDSHSASTGRHVPGRKHSSAPYHLAPAFKMNQQKNRPPRKKRPAASDVEHTGRKGPGERPAPAAAERTEQDALHRATPEPAATHSQPITNQDEQDKITNDTSDDAPNV